MDFLSLITNSIKDENNITNMKGYFLREFKKTERDEFYSIVDFFASCETALLNLENQHSKGLLKDVDSIESTVRWAEKCKKDLAANLYYPIESNTPIDNWTNEDYEQYSRKKYDEILERSFNELMELKKNRELIKKTFSLIRQGAIDARKELSNKNQKQLYAPEIALFCSLIDQSRIELQGELSNEDYCKNVCQRFNLPYTDNVRKAYRINAGITKTNPHLRKITELIQPNLPPEINKRLQTLIDSKLKLYG